jgi:cytochrome c5
MSENAPNTAHNGPIKTPKQFLSAVALSFILAVFAIIGLAFYVASASKPMAGADNSERAIAGRIQKIGVVEIKEGNRPLRTGEEVYKVQCFACHATGAMGSPKFGDAAAWAPRIGTGFAALLNSALKGKNNMTPQGGGDFQDVEVARAIVYMTTAAGGKFPEPAVPAGAGAAPAADAAAPAAAAPAAAAPAAKVAAAGAGAGEALYKQVCVACHAAGVMGAPKFGDKAAWEPRIKTSLETLKNSAIKGKNSMPPKGGSAASDADVYAAVEYMVKAAK